MGASLKDLFLSLKSFFVLFCFISRPCSTKTQVPPFSIPLHPAFTSLDSFRLNLFFFFLKVAFPTMDLNVLPPDACLSYLSHYVLACQAMLLAVTTSTLTNKKKRNHPATKKKKKKHLVIAAKKTWVLRDLLYLPDLAEKEKTQNTLPLGKVSLHQSFDTNTRFLKHSRFQDCKSPSFHLFK